MWKTDPKDKHIHKNKHVEHVCNSELWEREKGKENDRPSIIL
jgi:hypothetical protein